MAILTKITKNKKIFSRVLLDLGGHSYYRIEGEDYYHFFPYQALALQRLGMELEFYKANKIIPGISVVPEGVKIEKVELKPCVYDEDMLDRFVEKLKTELD